MTAGARVDPSTVVAVLLPWAALAADPAGLQPLGPAKFPAVALALTVAGVLLARRGRLPAPAPGPWPWIALLAWFAVTTVTADAWRWGLTGSPSRTFGLLGWSLLPLASSVGRGLAGAAVVRRQALRSLAVSGVVVATYALVQRAGLDPLDWTEGLDTSRATSLLGNASFLGAHLCLVVPAGVALALDERDPTWRVAGACSALLGAAAAVASQSRGGLLGLVVAVGLLATSAAARPVRTRTRREVAVAVALAAAVLVALAVPRLATLDATGTVRGRALLWSSSVELIGDAPLLGTGPESFRRVAPATFDERHAEEIGVAVVSDRAHQPFLDVGVGSGLPGLALLAWLVGATVAVLWRRLRASGDLLVAAAAAGALGYLAQLQVSISVAWLDALAWLLVGLAVARSTDTDTDADADTRTGTDTGTGTDHRPPQRAVTGSVIVLGLVAVGWGVSGLLADRAAARAEAAVATRDVPAAVTAAEDAARVGGWRGEYQQVAMRVVSAAMIATADAGDPAWTDLRDRALDHARRNVADSAGDPAYLLDLADLHLAIATISGDPADARAAVLAFERLLEVAPVDPRARQGLVEAQRLEVSLSTGQTI